MSKKPLVSVCVITFNHEQYIAKALDSILAQETSFEYEILVGDDASSDRTPQIIKTYAERYPSKIRAFLHPSNLGCLGKHNLSHLFLESRGEYVAVLEGDDFWTHSSKLQRQADALNTYPDIAACFHNVLVVDRDGASLRRLLRSKSLPESVFGVESFLRTNIAQLGSTMYRAHLLMNLPQWFFEVGAGDWALNLIASLSGFFMYIPEVYGAYRIHPGGIWSHGQEASIEQQKRRFLAELKQIEIHLENLPQLSGLGLNEIRNETECSGFLYALLTSRSWKAAGSEFLGQIRRSPFMIPRVIRGLAAKVRLRFFGPRPLMSIENYRKQVTIKGS